MMATGPRHETRQYLQVHVAPHDVAIPLGLVLHIRSTAAVRRQNGGHALEVEGAPVPVVDLASILGLPTRTPDWSESLVVIGEGGERYALRVDRTCEILELSDRNVHAVTGVLEIPVDLLIGVALQPLPLAVLDGPRLLAECQSALS
jgi:chemotaxis signal transduction protein